MSNVQIELVAIEIWMQPISFVIFFYNLSRSVAIKLAAIYTGLLNIL